MARTKNPNPMQRQPSDTYFHRSNGQIDKHLRVRQDSTANGFVKDLHAPPLHKQAGLMELLFCVGGIYMSLYVMLSPTA
jgi:hypothetical protein